MTVPSQQSGFVLLLMLFMLLGAGIAGLNQTHGYRAAKSIRGFSTDQYALQTARQALLTYTALYPWLYGPRGAGPGHLPCPDTDGQTIPLRSQASNRDGPNPPCGSETNATGLLPRHVSLAGHRYVFHVEPYQRLEYRVSSDMINNPVNRIINDAVIRGDHQQWPFVAWVHQPLDETDSSQPSISRIPVSRESLLPGVRRSVAAWWVRQVNRERGEVCSLSAEWLLASASADAPDLLSLVAQRESGSVRQASTPLVGSGKSCIEQSPQGQAVDDRLIEGVPLAAHWFVRNGWHERIVVQPSESCAASVSENCILVFDPSRLNAEPSDERLYFSWQAIS